MTSKNQPGLVSVTFRKLSPEQIIALCVETGLKCIEWGGDVHVPAGDLIKAAQVGEATRQAGVSVAAYGSYYRLAVQGEVTFESVLTSAEALGAPAVRVWAGSKGSAASNEAERAGVADDALRCADLAGAKGITVCYEFHDGTLTDTTESALELLGKTEHPYVKSLWQPPHGKSLEHCLHSLRAIVPRLHHIHAFHWWPDPAHRHPFSAARDRWEAYFAELNACGKKADFLLEFVLNDDPAQLSDDARTLRAILEK